MTAEYPHYTGLYHNQCNTSGQAYVTVPVRMPSRVHFHYVLTFITLLVSRQERADSCFFAKIMLTLLEWSQGSGCTAGRRRL